MEQQKQSGNRSFSFRRFFFATEVWAFARQYRRGHIIFACCATLVAALFVAVDYDNGTVGWWGWLEPVVGVTTLAVALAVWMGELRQDWENSLPKRLTVSFQYQGKEYMRCEQAYLAGEADIRAWGQQLGSQMAGTPFLRFQPNILQQPGKICREHHTGACYKLYLVTFFLTHLPLPHRDSSGAVINAGETSRFENNEQCIWKYCPEKDAFSEKKWRKIPLDQGPHVRR